MLLPKIQFSKTSEFRVPTPKSCSCMKVSVSIIMDNQSRLLFPKTLPTYGDDSSDSRLKQVITYIQYQVPIIADKTDNDITCCSHLHPVRYLHIYIYLDALLLKARVKSELPHNIADAYYQVINKVSGECYQIINKVRSKSHHITSICGSNNLIGFGHSARIPHTAR